MESADDEIVLVETELVVVVSTFPLSKVELERLELDVEETAFTEVEDVDVWPRGNIFPSTISFKT